MKVIKVLLDFIKLSSALKIPFYRNVIKQLRANGSTFPNPDVNLDTASSTVDVFDEKYAISLQTGGHQATVNLRNAEVDADKLFKTLALYVDRIADGNEAIILLAGFNPSNQPSPFTKPDLSVNDGDNSGSVKLVAKAVEFAGAYIWQSAVGAIPADDAAWTIAGYSTQASFTILGLTPGTKYYFRLAAICPDGVTDFNAPVMKIVI